jgi:HipA-like protein
MNGSNEIGTNSELFVWVYPKSSAEPIHCGVLELIAGRLCRFEYAPAWLARTDAFELSPDLPLRKGKFEPDAGLNIHPIFADAGPDRWGRQIIDRVFRLRRSSEIDYLAIAGEDRIGALAAYDLQPQLQGIRYQQMKVGRFDYEPSMRNVLSNCGRFMLTEAEACSEIVQIMAVLERWQEQFAAEGVHEDDIEACARYVRVGEMANELETLCGKPARALGRSASPSGRG